MDDYQNVFQAMLARRTSTEAVEQRRIVAVQMRRTWLMGHLSDWWYNRIGGYYGGSGAGLRKPAAIRVQRDSDRNAGADLRA